MYPLIAVFLAVLTAYAQSPAATSSDFEKVKPGEFVAKTPHVHVITGNCKSGADRVYGKADGVYYACVKGKEVCSNEKGAIPAKLISTYDANRAKARTRTATKAAPKQDPPAAATPPAKVEMARAGVISTVDTLPSAAPAKPWNPIAEERVKAIAMGTDRDDVIQKLGEPYMRISGSVERFTYLLTSKNTAQLVFANGKLTQTRFVPAQ